MAAAQALAARRDERRYAAPGRLVDVDGRRWHVVMAGEQHTGPTVVLEAGLGSFSSNWHWVLGELAESSPVMAYDRAGLGWSDPPAGRRDAMQLAAELHAVLQRTDLPAPYVLAGHSFGGLPVRAFAQRFPAAVAGVVLVDASHPEQWRRWPLPGADRLLEASQWITSGGAIFGLLRAIDLSVGVSAGLPPQQVAEIRARLALPRTAATEARQIRAWRTASADQLATSGSLGDLPLFVLSVTEQPRGDEILTALQAELPALSSNSVHYVVKGATHEGLLSDPAHAPVVATAIRNVVEAAGTGGRVSTLGMP
jgi:pimeloyl-ACP methyl ester carboxylesterase